MSGMTHTIQRANSDRTFFHYLPYKAVEMAHFHKFLGSHPTHYIYFISDDDHAAFFFHQGKGIFNVGIWQNLYKVVGYGCRNMQRGCWFAQFLSSSELLCQTSHGKYSKNLITVDY